MSTKPVASSTTQLQRYHHRRGQGSGRIVSGVGVMIFMLLLGAYFLFPLLWLLVASTKSTTELFSTPMLGLAKEVHFWNNLRDLTLENNGLYWRWYLNSIVSSTAVASGATRISALAGYALAKYNFVFKQTAFMLVLISLLVPGAALSVPIFLLVRASGMVNTYFAVIVPLLISPFGVYFMNVYIGESMPTELINSGRVDGASEFQIFLRIAMPIIRPGLLTLFLIAFIGAWNNFFLPLLVVSDPNLLPLTLGINIWVSTISASTNKIPPYPFIMMGSLLSVLPMVVLFPVLRKQIAAGLITGGLKM